MIKIVFVLLLKVFSIPISSRCICISHFSKQRDNWSFVKMLSRSTVFFHCEELKSISIETFFICEKKKRRRVPILKHLKCIYESKLKWSYTSMEPLHEAFSLHDSSKSISSIQSKQNSLVNWIVNQVEIFI